jgi:hypothetical protein
MKRRNMKHRSTIVWDIDLDGVCVERDSTGAGRMMASRFYMCRRVLLDGEEMGWSWDGDRMDGVGWR